MSADGKEIYERNPLTNVFAVYPHLVINLFPCVLYVIQINKPTLIEQAFHKSFATDLLAPLGLTFSREDNLTNGGDNGALGGEKVKVNQRI